MGTPRILPLFLSAVVLAFPGCRRDSTPSRADVAVTKDREGDSKAKTEPAKTKEDGPKAKEQANEKERLPERVADCFLAFWMLDIVSENKVSVLALDRFAAYEETLELRLARCLLLANHDLKVDAPRFETKVKLMLTVTTKVQKPIATDAKYLNDFVKAQIAGFVQSKKSDIKEAHDKVEMTYNVDMTPARAADLVHAAAIVRSATTKEMSEVRTQMKRGLAHAITGNPEILTHFVAAQETTDEVRKSRERVREMIRQAGEK